MHDISDRVLSDIVRYAKKNHVERVILFGSRARGDHRERSDIDLAVQGGNAACFHEDLEEYAWTLLKFDVVDLGRWVNDTLCSEIDRDGVMLYEET